MFVPAARPVAAKKIVSIANGNVSAIVDLMTVIFCTTRNGLLQLTEIGSNGFDLRLGQAMRNRLHDG